MAIPQGLLAAVLNSSGQVISTTTSPGTAVTGMSITVTLGSNRNVRLRAVVNGQFSSSAGIASLAIFEGSTNLAQANFGAGVTSGEDSATVESIQATGILGTSPTAGSHTYVVKMWCAGGGTFTFLVSNTSSLFTCEDV